MEDTTCGKKAGRYKGFKWTRPISYHSEHPGRHSELLIDLEVN